MWAPLERASRNFAESTLLPAQTSLEEGAKGSCGRLWESETATAGTPHNPARFPFLSTVRPGRFADQMPTKNDGRRGE